MHHRQGGEHDRVTGQMADLRTFLKRLSEIIKMLLFAYAGHFSIDWLFG